MRYKSVLVTIVALIACFKCSNDHSNRKDTEQIRNLEQIIKDNSFTQGKLDDRYTQHSIKLKHTEGEGVPTSYDFTFTYRVNDNAFFGNATYSSLPTMQLIQVYYLKEKPEVYSLNPQEDLKKAQAKAESNVDLYFTIGWGLICFIGAFTWYKEFKESKAEDAQKEAARKKRMADFKKGM